MGQARKRGTPAERIDKAEERAAMIAQANQSLTGAALSVGRLMSVVFPIVMLILNLSMVAVLWFGAHRIDAGDMQVGALTAYMAYLIQILMSVMMATITALLSALATRNAPATAPPEAPPPPQVRMIGCSRSPSAGSDAAMPAISSWLILRAPAMVPRSRNCQGSPTSISVMPPCCCTNRWMRRISSAAWKWAREPARAWTWVR